MQFAIIKTGGKQYKVSEGDTIEIEKLEVAEGGEIVFDQVLLIDDGKDSKIGKPLVTGAKVTAKLIEQGKADKVIVFRYKSKTRYKKKKGHRQPYTKIEIIKISA